MNINNETKDTIIKSSTNLKGFTEFQKNKGNQLKLDLFSKENTTDNKTFNSN